MKIRQGVQSVLRIKLTSADPPRLLEQLTAAGISLEEVSLVDDITVELSLQRKYWEGTQKIIRQRQVKMELLERQGIFWKAAALGKRPLLLASFALLLLASLMLPGRILLVRVQGNHSVEELRILEEAERAGVGFWSERRDIHSEQIKNQLLDRIPQLQWVGVNTSGCVATISVTERSQKEERAEFGEISSIVAAVDGVIHSATATDGNMVCSVGQAVKAGEVLISAYTDCGLTIRATKARGEIFAETLRDVSAVIPLQSQYRGDVQSVKRKYSLLLGKKRINFYKGSGISGTSCGKMYEQYYLTLPGDFRLPVALAVETVITYASESIDTAADTLEENLQRNAEEYLLGHMVAGKIIAAATQVDQAEGICQITGRYRCLEMIGREQSEEITAKYGESD